MEEVANNETSNSNHDNDDDIPSVPMKTQIKAEPIDKSETTVVVLNRHDKFNARPKPDESTLRHYCNKCDARFKFPYQLSKHKKYKHEGKYPYQCKICDKPFVNLTSFKEHRFVHTDERPFSCTKCDKKFKMKGNLRKHMWDIHPEETSRPKLIFQCEYCSKIFKTKESLTSHFICHTSEKAFTCDICEKKFNRKNNLNIHRLIHFPEKKFKCPDCPMRFNREYSLKIHARNHLAVKPYKCEMCPSSFSQLHALKTHFRLHTGEKPFKCTECPQSFRQLATLQVHLKRHSGVKDFKCTLCDSAFVIKRRLTEHMRTHTGEKPFSCEFCSYKGATSSAIKLHTKTHLRKMNNPTSKTDTTSNGGLMGSDRKRRSRYKSKTKVDAKFDDNGEEMVTKNVDDNIKVVSDVTLEDDKLTDGPQVCNSNFEITTEYDIDVDIGENGVKIEPIDDLVEENDEDGIVDNDNNINNIGSDFNNIQNNHNIENGINNNDLSNIENNHNDIASIHIANANEFNSKDDNIGIKVSNIRSIAVDCAAESKETNNVSDETPYSAKKKTNRQSEFKFMANEILYKHLNDLIPAIDADTLFIKIDCMVNELCDLKKNSDSVKCNRKNVRKKNGKQSSTTVTVSKNHDVNENLDTNLMDTNVIESMASLTTKRAQMLSDFEAKHKAVFKLDNSIDMKVEPDSPLDNLFSNEPSQSASQIQACHPTLSQSLLLENTNHFAPPSLDTAPPTFHTNPPNSSIVHPIHNIATPTSSMVHPMNNLTPPTLKMVQPIQGLVTPTSLFKNHTISSSSNGMRINNTNGSLDNSKSSTIRKLLSHSPANTKPAKTNNYNSAKLTSPHKNITPPSGKSQVLQDILSRPSQYLMASRNSVATLQHAQMLKQLSSTKGRINNDENDDDDDDLGSNDFPWISIENVKIEPLSDGEN